jgi:hypothetical protein
MPYLTYNTDTLGFIPPTRHSSIRLKRNREVVSSIIDTGDFVMIFTKAAA